MITADIGRARLSPNSPVTAGELCTLSHIFICGHPIDDSGYIKIVFRYAGDFGVPQFHDPTGANFCHIHTTGNCVIEPRWDPKGHVRPWGKALYLKICGGYLDRNERVELTFGDQSEGSPGWEMQTFCERSLEFRTFVDPYATFQFLPVPNSPTIEVLPGQAVHAMCIAPSVAQVGKPFHYFVKREDRCGNPVDKPKEFSHPGFSEPGIRRVAYRDSALQEDVISNPIEICSQEATGRFWADFHAQSEETIGTNSINDYFEFARDYALLDIAGHQGNDFQITDEFWKRINETCDDFNRDDSFVALPGYEWSGNTPLGGDRNVYYSQSGCPIHRSSRALVHQSETPTSIEAPTASELFSCLRPLSRHAFVFAHVGGRYADLRMHDPELEIAVEVHSAWGTFEWLVEDAFRLGYRVGICSNSDDHKGRPGASYPGSSLFGSYGGLTCIRATELSRDGITQALRERRFYATTGARINLDVHVDQGDGKLLPMGAISGRTSSEAKVHVRVAGTAPIQSIEIRNGLQISHVIYPTAEDSNSRRFWLLWKGAECRGRGRLVTWDGTLSITNNEIVEFQPINFWSLRHKIDQLTAGVLKWSSATTGGIAGVLFHLAESDKGAIEIQTKQGDAAFSIGSIGQVPLQRAFGGLGKEIFVERLASSPGSLDAEANVALDDLHDGDNPIYVRVLQEDGHMAWSSPIYII